MSSAAVYVAMAARAALAVVFLLAGVSKLGRGARAEFRDAVTGLLPATWRGSAGGLAVAAVTAEWLIVALLAVPGSVTGAAGLVLAAAALTVFSAVLVRALRHGATTPCRCFSASTRPLSRLQLARNAAMLTLAAVGLVATVGTLQFPSGGEPAPTAGLWIAIAVGVLLGAALTAFEDLVDLFTPLAPATSRAAPTGITVIRRPARQENPRP